MAENILNSVEKADKCFEDVMKSSKPFKQRLRVQLAYLRILQDEEIQGKSIEALDKILEKKLEYMQDLQEVTNLCHELKNNLDKLDYPCIIRDNKGRRF